ncbi:MAG: CpsD/CapB family tyrosine-protein kinase [Clostridia bacterium]|nr:CpsD/CapB family tyrosine-protein kinase [Clostridia bacterium]
MKLSKRAKKKYDALNTHMPLHKNLGFAAMEQYKLLRTNLSFVLPEDVKCPIIGVTSSVRGEGKSTTAINLAYALAADKKKVLLIDGDLRLPSIAKKMDVSGTYGLTNLLMTYDVEDLEQFRSNVLDRWYIIPSGHLPPNPSELLGSSKMQKLLGLLSEKFDYIILDLPPVSVVSDALAVSRLITGMVLVIREDYTDKKDLEACVRQLELSNVKVFGCVWNESKEGSVKKYKRYSGGYRYGYAHTKKGGKHPPAI